MPQQHHFTLLSYYLYTRTHILYINSTEPRIGIEYIIKHFLLKEAIKAFPEVKNATVAGR